MCGRITLQLSPDQIGELYGVRATPLPPEQPPRYNGTPGQDFIACRVEPHGARVNSVRNDGPDILTPLSSRGLF